MCPMISRNSSNVCLAISVYMPGWVCLEEGGAGHRSQPAHVLTWPLWCLV